MMALYNCQEILLAMQGEIYPVAGFSAFVAMLIIAVVYASSQATGNPKLSVWARTEAVQLIMTASFIFIVISLIQSFCSLQVGDLASLASSTPVAGYDPAMSIYGGAEAYLLRAANYSHTALINTRYYMGVINIAEVYSIWECPMWCFLSIGGTGESYSPQAGASYLSSGFMLPLNSSMMSFFSSFMHLFFLKYIGSGLFLFLFPVGLITRSLPYMRLFGSLMVAVIFSLYIVYPSILASYYAFVEINFPERMSEADVDSSAGSWLTGSGYSGPEVTPDDLAKSARQGTRAFFYSVFLPTLALLAAAAATVYIARLMGEEIDLSRLVQMV